MIVSHGAKIIHDLLPGERNTFQQMIAERHLRNDYLTMT